MKELFADKNRRSGILLAAMIWVLALQSPLESVWDQFSYIDEIAALIGVILCGYDLVLVRKCRLPRNALWVGLALGVFVAAGLAGNVIYRYQILSAVVIDLYTNLKFFFAIAAGYYLFRNTRWETLKKSANIHIKIIVVCIFCVFLLDRVFDFYPCETRYGIKSAKLFFYHPTYLAGAMVFLMMLLTVFYEKKNLPYIVMAGVMMALTLRSKAIVGAFAYAALFLFFLVFKRRLKLWHVVLMGVGCCILAWPQIHYYFIELGDTSTRSVMHSVAFRIMGDYFPIGTGFGTYASSEAAKHFSPVYEIYNFEYLLRFEANRQWVFFLNDTFWPIIIGQTGAIGTAAYLTAMFQILRKSLRLDRFSIYAYVGVLFAFVYLLISSAAEPAFNNSLAVPLALSVGMAFGGVDNANRIWEGEKKTCLQKN